MAFENYSDFFTSTTLLEAVAAQPYVPSRLAQLFETRALPGTQLALEAQPAEGGAAITATARGTPSGAVTLERRAVHTFSTAHYRVDGAVYADEVLNARAMGANAVGELITARRDETLATMRRNIDATLETLRLACLITPTNAFGTKPSDATIAFQTDATKVRQELFAKVVVPIENALAGVPFSGVTILCSDGVWEKVVDNADIRQTYLYTSNARALQGDTRDMVTWGGVTFERYRGTGSMVLTANKAIAVPTGVPGMWLQAFAPADTLDAVGAGALGQPFYAQAYEIDGGNRGWRLEMQTNPVMVCTRPTAVITIKMS